MDSPTPDAPDSGNAPSGDSPGDAAPQDGSLHVRPRQESTPETPPAKTPEAATPPGDVDEVLFHGSVSLWMGWRSIAGATVAALLGVALLITGLVYGNWLRTFGIYVGLPLFLAAALMFGYVCLSLRCLRYKITNRLIERERGIVVKRVDSLDLSRVKDVQLVQNLMERMLRIGTIEILSSDRTDPLMRIEAIPKPRPVYEKLRDTVIRISQKRGIIAMDR